MALGSACTDDAAAPSGTSETGGTGQPDLGTVVTGDTGPPVDLVGPELDTATDPDPNCDPGEGCFLEACATNEECKSLFCVDHLGESVCTKACVAECPPGFTCEEVTGEGADLVFICLSKATHLCRPCNGTLDCGAPTGVEDVCLDYGEEGSFCGASCDQDSDCPFGFSCTDATTTDGVTLQQCVSDLGTCPCAAQSVRLGLTTGCAITNDFGSCEGKRVCTDDGLSDCDAQTPAAELCDGEDNDCDGETDEGGCDDGNPCTTDSCLGASGCEHLALDAGECLDGDVCTTGDHCETGSCVGAPVLCADDDPCTDDECDSEVGCVFPHNEAPCDDGEACTIEDVCADGLCGGEKAGCECVTTEDCAALEDGNLCTGTLVCDTSSLPYHCAVDPGTVVTCPEPTGDQATCNAAVCEPATGECSVVPAKDGFACDDGDACTLAEVCTGGQCAGGIVTSCFDDELCTDDGCAPGSGCFHTPNALPCSDGDPCTVGDACTNGSCKSGGAISCDDGNPCTDDACSPTGCSHTPNAAPCDDGDACTVGDHCAKGVCANAGPPDCNDGEPCTVDACDSKSGCKWFPGAGICDDGDACTTGDACLGSQCVGLVDVDCDDQNPCTDDACSPVDGCTNLAKEADEACDDGNVCTTGDHCADGACTFGAGLPCLDGNPCTDDACDPATGCVYAPTAAPCSDGSACTTGDQCAGGACTGSPVSCDDGNGCTDDSCEDSAGCVFVAKEGGCDDGSACTSADTCMDGACTGTPLPCNDGNACTDDSCDKTSGCVFAPNAALCGDGDACTKDDACTGGLCSGAPVDCDDGNPCTDDSCAKALGCVHVPNTAACNDGSDCTTGDACLGGTCQGVGLVCDDGNPCTDDGCDQSGGCLFTPNSASCDDGSACTIGDACAGSACAGIAIVCDDANPCTDDACAAGSGCQYTPNALTCDDGDACTASDTCGATTCAGTPITCDDGKLCTDDSCDKAAGCKYTPNVLLCDDGTACTAGDVCAGGSCQAGAAVTCDDGDPCTTDGCDPTLGCVKAPVVCPDDQICEGGTCVPDCKPVVYGTAGQGTNNGWTCDNVCAELGGVAGHWDSVDEQLAFCHSLEPDATDIIATPNNHSYPILDIQNDKKMCKVNADGTKGVSNWAGNGTPVYGDKILCRCTKSCTPSPKEVWLAYTDLFGGGIYLWKPGVGATKLGQCHQPWGIEYVAPDTLYVACVGVPDSVEKLTLSGSQTQIFLGDPGNNARDVVQGPDGGIYMSSANYWPSTVWKLNEATKTKTPYAKVGAQENMGIAFGADGSLFWADINANGKVFKVPPGGGSSATLLITGFPSGFSLRDLEIGADERLYLAGLTGAGGVRIYEQSGALHKSIDAPGKVYGLSPSATGRIYAMIDHDGGTDGIYVWDGVTWKAHLTGIAGIGGIHVVPQ